MRFEQLASYLEHELKHGRFPRESEAERLGVFLQAARTLGHVHLTQVVEELLDPSQAGRIPEAIGKLAAVVARSGYGKVEPPVPAIVLLRSRREPFQYLAVAVKSGPLRNVIVAIVKTACDLVVKKLGETKQCAIIADSSSFDWLLAVGGKPEHWAIVGDVGENRPGIPARISDLQGLLDLSKEFLRLG
jgi:hypothetical protein